MYFIESLCVIGINITIIVIIDKFDEELHYIEFILKKGSEKKDIQDRIFLVKYRLSKEVELIC